ncbi:hypothetical protein U9M48_021107 [Paspalum notatum var. saurae]|uniref:Secreted protein n=1 Tax=Paspalum notatum var. saurae TaxID=547442 RepID=A0AAQ3WSE2_PASNO
MMHLWSFAPSLLVWVGSLAKASTTTSTSAGVEILHGGVVSWLLPLCRGEDRWVPFLKVLMYLSDGA